MDAARDYLVDQLVIVARHLTETRIFRKDPDIPLCQLCLMTGINGRPIPHLRSCPVGQVLSAIEQLDPARGWLSANQVLKLEDQRWNGWDIEHPAATEKA